MVGLMQILKSNLKKLGDALKVKQYHVIEQYEKEKYSESVEQENPLDHLPDLQSTDLEESSEKEYLATPMMRLDTDAAPIDVAIKVFGDLKPSLCKKITIESLPTVINYLLTPEKITSSVDANRNGRNIRLNLSISTYNKTLEQIAYETLKLIWDGYVEAYYFKKTMLFGKRYLFEFIIFPRGLLIAAMASTTNNDIYLIFWLEDLKKLGRNND